MSELNPFASTELDSFEEEAERAEDITAAIGAGFWIRVLARLLDLVYVTINSTIAGLFAGIVIAVATNLISAPLNWKERMLESSWFSMITGTLLMALVHTIFEWLYGATPGKLACGLRVVKDDGAPLQVKGALVRNLGYLWDAFFFGWVGYNAIQDSWRNQRYGDQWAGSLVLKKAQVPNGARRSAFRFIAAIVLAGLLMWIYTVALFAFQVWG